MLKFKTFVHVWLFWSWESIENIWVHSMKVGIWRCSEEEPSGLAWGPLFSHVEICTNTKWSQIFVSNAHDNGRALCQIWTFFIKVCKFCHVRPNFRLFRPKNCSKCIKCWKWKQSCMCAWFDAGNTWKKVGGNTHLSWWGCFTKWTMQDEGFVCTIGIHRCYGTVMNPF